MKWRKGEQLTEGEIKHMVDADAAMVYAIYEDPEDSNFNARGIARITTANVGYFCNPFDDGPDSFGNSIDFELSGEDDATFDDGALRLYMAVEVKERVKRPKPLDVFRDRVRAATDGLTVISHSIVNEKQRGQFFDVIEELRSAITASHPAPKGKR